MIRSPLALLLLVAAPTLVAQQPTYHAVRQSQADPAVAALPGGYMLSIPGVQTDFVIAGGGQFVELPNGTARLTGRVFGQQSVYSAFLVDLEFSGRVAPGDAGYPPAGAPDLQLLPAAYAPAGSVDPSTFVYYTAAVGTLVGVRAYDGFLLSLQSSGLTQVGVGANNRNGLFGLQADFTVQVTQQLGNPIFPLGTASLVVDLPTDKAFFATHPLPDPLRTTLPEGRAMVLPGVGDDYVFVPAGVFTEYDDGHAVLQGRLARISNLDDAWGVVVNLTNRLDPGQAGHPPAGSPVLQLLPSAYVQNGGTLDPGHWRYYQAATGTLTGEGLNAGGVVALTNTLAVQVGGGSNQANTYVGYHGQFAVSVTTQPNGRTIAVNGTAELFGTTAVFPVLPFPTLVAPPTTPSLSTLTHQGFVLQGDHLAWAELIAIGWDLVGGRDASQWSGGWFRVLDNQHIEVHPRPGAVPGTYPVAVYNPIIASNSVPLDLYAPTGPTLLSEPAVDAWGVQHLFAYSGPVLGPAACLIALSTDLLPSAVPGLIALDIGDQFQSLIIDWTIRLHDPASGIAHADYWNIPSDFGGLVYHLQAAVLDFGAPNFVFLSTNVWDCDY